MRIPSAGSSTALLVVAVAAIAAIGVARPVAPFPEVGSPAADTAYFAGGCFWGVEAVFEHVRGVENVVSGYATADAASPVQPVTYDRVSSGSTRFAEAVRVVYDPAKVTYAQLLDVFFLVAHDPTQVNRQGPDVGPQYRSAVFWQDDAQKRAAQGAVAKLAERKTFSRPVATELGALRAWREAEPEHQDYVRRNPQAPYVVVNDLPKLEHLRERYPKLWR